MDRDQGKQTEQTEQKDNPKQDQRTSFRQTNQSRTRQTGCGQNIIGGSGKLGGGQTTDGGNGSPDHIDSDGLKLASRCALGSRSRSGLWVLFFSFARDNLSQQPKPRAQATQQNPRRTIWSDQNSFARTLSSSSMDLHGASS